MDHLRQYQVGILPENGVMANEHQSKLALKYIQWLEEVHGTFAIFGNNQIRPKSLNVNLNIFVSDIELQYKLRDREFEVVYNGRKMRVDAYHEETNTIYEILGCFYHGCRDCANRDKPHPLYNKTMGQVSLPNCFQLCSTLSVEFIT